MLGAVRESGGRVNDLEGGKNILICAGGKRFWNRI